MQITIIYTILSYFVLKRAIIMLDVNIKEGYTRYPSLNNIFFAMLVFYQYTKSIHHTTNFHNLYL